MKYKLSGSNVLYDLPDPKSLEWLEAFYPNYTGSSLITLIDDLSCYVEGAKTRREVYDNSQFKVSDRKQAQRVIITMTELARNKANQRFIEGVCSAKIMVVINT